MAERPHSRQTGSVSGSGSAYRRESSSSSGSSSGSSSASSSGHSFGGSSGHSSGHSSGNAYRPGGSTGSFQRTGSSGGYSSGGSFQSTGSSGYSGGPHISKGGIGGIGIIAVIAVILILVLRNGSCAALTGNSGYNTNTGNTGNIGSVIGDLFGGNTGVSSYSSSGSSIGTYASMSDVNRSVSPLARTKFTNIAGIASPKTTIMVYFCGSNLESKSGMATGDIKEMLSSNIGNDNVHLILETGGAKTWQNNTIPSNKIGRYEVTNGGLKDLGSVSNASMTDAKTLSSFIKFSVKNYPADRYMLIMWDHGGGSVTGFGSDENYPGDSMTIAEMADALSDSGVTFDFIGFDACLMATLETAYALKPYSDYLIASEETEPGRGWYYTNWLNDITSNPGISTLDLGKRIIDDYVSHSNSDSPGYKTTLSLTDLSEFEGTVPSALTNLGQALYTSVKTEQKKISAARSDTREFGSSSRLDQVDLVDFYEKLGTSEAKALSDAVRGSVKYNLTNNISDAYGMSFYFPKNSNKTNSMVKIYDEIGMDKSYSASIKSYAGLSASGQIASTSGQGGSGSLLGSLFGGSSGSSIGSLFGGSSSGGFNVSSILSLLTSATSGSSQTIGADAVTEGYQAGYPGATMNFASLLGDGFRISDSELQENAQYIAANAFDGSKLAYSEVDGKVVVSLSENDWEKIETVELSVFVDDGGGYIDLGLDNRFNFDTYGNLIADYDRLWVALDGQPCAYYLLSDDYDETTGRYETIGYVPALVNDERMDIILKFTDQNPDGTVLGGRVMDSNGTLDRGLYELKAGDTIDLLCNYYSYNMTFDDSYFLGETWTLTGTPKVSMIRLDNSDFMFGYRFTDSFGANYWTPMIK